MSDDGNYEKEHYQGRGEGSPAVLETEASLTELPPPSVVSSGVACIPLALPVTVGLVAGRAEEAVELVTTEES